MLKISEGDEGLPGYLGAPDATASGAPASARDDEWTTGMVVREKTKTFAALLPLLAGGDEKKILAAIMDGFGTPGSDETASGRLRSFLHAVSALRFDAEHGGLSRAQREQIATFAEGLLKAQGIGTSSSKLGFLHGDLEMARAQAELKQGKLWAGAVSQQLAQSLCRRQPSGGPGFQALASALRCLRLGHAPLAAEGLAAAEALALPPAHFQLARLSRLVALRLSGELQTGQALLDASFALPELSEGAKTELAWEKLWLESLRTRDHGPLIAAAQRGRPHYHPTYLLEAHLLARAVASQSLVKRLPKPATIKRVAGPLLHRGSPHAFLLDCVVALEDAYDNALSIERKLEEVRKAMANLSRLRTVDREVLAWAAFARWAQRYHQGVLAAMALAEYRSLSLKLSAGKHSDVACTSADLNVQAWARYQHAGAERLAAFQGEEAPGSLVTSTLGRSVEVSKLSAVIAGILAKRHVLGTSGERAQEDARKLADYLVSKLGRLKGPLMKLAQSLSYLPTSLPEEFRQGLSTLQQGAQPIDGASIKKLVEQELGQPVGQLFAAWEDRPFAAGSMGQVHRAKLPNGDAVAVKVRYPGIEKVVEGDFRALKLLVPFIKPFLPKSGLKNVVDELGSLMLLECDYRNEASFQTEFRAVFADDPRVVIPKVYPERSSVSVLTTELIEGQPFADFNREASQEEKNEAAAIIFEMVYRSIFRHGLLNADPHPGNYVFLRDGRVAFLDFGFARRWTPEKVAQMRAIARASWTKDKPAFARALQEIGVAPTGPAGKDFDFDYQFHVAVHISGLPFVNNAPFQFTREHVDKELKALVVDNPNLKKVRLPPEFTAIDRLTWGTHSVLAALGAEVNWHCILAPLIGLPLGPPSPVVREAS